MSAKWGMIVLSLVESYGAVDDAPLIGVFFGAEEV
jgi:hypothetical protein